MQYQTIAAAIHEEIAACDMDMQQLDERVRELKAWRKDMVKARAKLRRMLATIQKENKSEVPNSS